jgi:hypothetical protein
MNVSETPEKWVIIKTPSCYKVFGTWAGGYLTSDSWRINSGITDVKEDEHNYYFMGFSGSCYKCNKNSYGFASSYGSNVLVNIIKKTDNTIELLEDQDNWVDFLKFK